MKTNAAPTARSLRVVAATFRLRIRLPRAPGGESKFSSHHDSRSERLSWGNQLVAGLGSPLPAIINSNDLIARRVLPEAEFRSQKGSRRFNASVPNVCSQALYTLRTHYAQPSFSPQPAGYPALTSKNTKNQKLALLHVNTFFQRHSRTTNT